MSSSRKKRDYLGVPNHLSNIVLGIAGTAEWAMGGSVAAMAGHAMGFVPGIGFAVSVLDFGYAWEQYHLKVVRGYGQKKFNDNGYYNKTVLASIGYIGLLTRLGSSAFLGVTSLQEVYALVAGVPGCGLVPIAYAVKSGVDLLGAMTTIMLEALHDTSPAASERKTAAAANVGAKLLSFIGWTLLACGHPAGWVVLAATFAPQVVRLCYSMFKQKAGLSETGVDHGKGKGKGTNPDNGWSGHAVVI